MHLASSSGEVGVANLLTKISSDVHAAKKLLSLSSSASSESDKSRATVFKSLSLRKQMFHDLPADRLQPTVDALLPSQPLALADH